MADRFPTADERCPRNGIVSKMDRRIKPKDGNKTFCMAPWTHTYLSPQTERRMCCASREPAQSFKQYIDTVFLDTGYRNRFKISETLDMLIEKKLEESEETEIYTNKDMADLLQMAHKMRIEEMKAQTELKKAEAQSVKNQVNIQHNSELPFGQGNYGELIKKLLK